jgi:hypothetical protein
MTRNRRPARRAGMIFTLDNQADAWQGQYKLIRCIAPNTWETEYLPDPPETTARILDYWATAEHPYLSPIWDKEWAECAEGEHPQRIGEKTRGQMAAEELAQRAARAGTRSTVKFISAARYAEYF